MKIAVLLLIFGLAGRDTWCQTQPGKTLYERLGRYDAIVMIVDEYLKGIRADPQFARFSGRGADSLARARQLLKDQLCALTGGPCVYIGRGMKTVHAGLAITGADWSVSMKHMTNALEKAHVSGNEKSEFVALIESMRQQFVEKE